ncbi:hypothetical protein QLL95_gp0667 [Cotonvirus japonicus]|uniref:Uncharacterized protein n=1 Tax=Cotonvirus japonicus TaxID=2811091 RepID=A0ABM7NTL9_9VIRU|nr:hypothetical protein QLL95_gp0667 [Cotonvirus japonicus]BCS83456.1 hypothetical protein [Cotonvirus japonicus]
MCIVADSVKNVDNTKIASMHVAYKTNNSKIIPAQLVVYAATINSSTKTNALILPVYNPGNNTNNIIPLDMSDYSDFFNEMYSLYSRWFPEKTTLSYSRNSITNNFDNSTLEVYKVGDYKFSLMPSKKDFIRLNKEELNIDPQSRASIDVHSNDYSFIVYQFYQQGNIDITPFAYLCKPFSENSMIIPTIHGHPDSVDARRPWLISSVPRNFYKDILRNDYSVKSYDAIHPYSDIPYDRTNESILNFEPKGDFDHEIYLLVKNKNLQSSKINQSDVKDFDELLRKINKDYLNNHIEILIPNNFTPKKIKITGTKTNRNIMANLHGEKFVHDLIVDQIN